MVALMVSGKGSRRLGRGLSIWLLGDGAWPISYMMHSTCVDATLANVLDINARSKLLKSQELRSAEHSLSSICCTSVWVLWTADARNKLGLRGHRRHRPFMGRHKQHTRSGSHVMPSHQVQESKTLLLRPPNPVPLFGASRTPGRA